MKKFNVFYVLSWVLLISCSKDALTDKADLEDPTKGKGPDATSKPITLVAPTNLHLSPLVDNHDGSWTGTACGMRLRFYGFVYELFYDVNGVLIGPKAKDAAWPSSIGPEPGVTSVEDFYCLNTILYPGPPNNQWTVQQRCRWEGALYYPGAGMTSYWNTVDANWSQYQNALAIYQALIGVGIASIPPSVPSSPDFTPYLLQDYSIPTGAPVFNTRFGIYSYNQSTGEVVIGMDAR